MRGAFRSADDKGRSVTGFGPVRGRLLGPWTRALHVLGACVASLLGSLRLGSRGRICLVVRRRPGLACLLTLVLEPRCID